MANIYILVFEGGKYIYFGQDEKRAEEQEGATEDGVAVEQTKNSGIWGGQTATGDPIAECELCSSNFLKNIRRVPF